MEDVSIAEKQGAQSRNVSGESMMKELSDDMELINTTIKQEPLEEALFVQTMTEGEPQDEEHAYPPLEPLTEVMTVQNVRQDLLQFKEEPEDVDSFSEAGVQSSDDVVIEDHSVEMQEESDGAPTSLESKNGSESLTASTGKMSSASMWYNIAEPGTSSLNERTDIRRKMNERQSQECSRKHNASFTSKNIFNTVTNSIETGQTLQKPHKCTECGKGFTQRGTMLRHLRVHSGEKPHTCDKCGKNFTQKHHLLEHLNIHSGEKPYKCKECGKCFIGRSALFCHLRIHTGEKPHKCEECRKYFTQKHNLLHHLRTHTGEKPHKCEECGRFFTHQGSLLRHLRIHSGVKPHKCEECNKYFTQKHYLLQHLRIHSGEKPHKCEECGKCFTRRGGLLRHIRTHSIGKPNKCQECGKCFVGNDNLCSHLRIQSVE